MPNHNHASAGYPEAERLELVEEIHGHRIATRQLGLRMDE